MLVLISDFFPICLKTAKVIPVHETGDKHEVANYRPISILSIFSKILEKVVHTQTLSFLKSHSLLTPTQYGLRRNYSTLYTLLDITNSSLDNIEKNIHWACIFRFNQSS